MPLSCDLVTKKRGQKVRDVIFSNHNPCIMANISSAGLPLEGIVFVSGASSPSRKRFPGSVVV